MTRSLHLFGRRLVAIVGAGMLLQAGGCALNSSTLATDLLVAVAQNVLANLVYGSFNLVGP